MTREHERDVAVTVDLVILTLRRGVLHVLLVERGKNPFFGQLALPGGYLRVGEELDHAAERELEEETGIAAGTLHLEQLRTYGAPDRDPRGRVVTVAYLALGPELPDPTAGSDAADALWVPVTTALDGDEPLAFDHHVILREAVERARSQLEYTTLATAFCREPFTVAELRAVYEAVWGLRLDPSNFRRKVTRTEGFVIATGERRTPEVGRPAALYRRGPAALLQPPLLRTGQLSQVQSSSGLL